MNFIVQWVGNMLGINDSQVIQDTKGQGHNHGS